MDGRTGNIEKKKSSLILEVSNFSSSFQKVMRMQLIICWCLFLVNFVSKVSCFQPHSFTSSQLGYKGSMRVRQKSQIDDDSFNSMNTPSKDDEPMAEAAINTINERLMAELKQAENKEKYGKRSTMSKSLGLSPFGSSLSDEDRQRAIEEARNLNGVNPFVAIGGGLVGLAIATGLWCATTALGTFFALHPVDTDVYFVSRVSSVIRNVAMGFSSLASGFFGVTGVGILALGIRVGYGVITGELDPTPIKKKASDEIEVPNILDLMMNKKPNRRRRE
jgi:hypothetical protein